mgnify:FL=1
MEKRIIECVPNFSEGRNKAVIQQITSAIEAVDGVKLLDVDPGEATNRTVVTFVGEPEAVLEAAFQGVKKAAEVIDMRNHKGAHPRMGATDVCPLIPIAGITLEECAELARQLAKRIADELHVPTYCYEAAAFTPERRNLAVCRAGEYEALPEKMNHEGKAPDFGDRPFDEGVARTGATAVGARDFLIAVNYNLNTTSTRRANAIAFDVREKGRPVREGNSPVGKPLKDENGKTNLALADVDGEVLVVSQFTLFADCRHGRRPSFTDAGAPDVANELYEYFLTLVREDVEQVAHGIFGADMKVDLVNDGPFTIVLDTDSL